MRDAAAAMQRRRRFIGLLTLALIAVTVAVGGVFAAQGGVQSSALHGPGYRGFSAFAINARNPQIVYAGSGRGVFKSSDGGASWQAVNEGLTDRYIFDLAIDEHHPTTLYAATGSGVFKTTNAAGLASNEHAEHLDDRARASPAEREGALRIHR